MRKSSLTPSQLNRKRVYTGTIRGGVDAPLTALLPEPSAPDKTRIKLEDVLTMRSGLDADDENAESAGNEDKMDRAPDWLAFALRVPMKDTPGRTYTYASVNAFLAGAVVERATGGPDPVPAVLERRHLLLRGRSLPVAHLPVAHLDVLGEAV